MWRLCQSEHVSAGAAQHLAAPASRDHTRVGLTPVLTNHAENASGISKTAVSLILPFWLLVISV